MKHKVIFDTNSIRNAESVSDFLGGRDDLGRFLKVSEIIIPDIVIEEIKMQKKKHLISKRDSFLSNPFHFLRSVDERGTNDFDIDNWISELAGKESVPYTVIFLSKKEGILEKIKKMCLECSPPFEENSDKGFKDAYIYFTILEFLDTCQEQIFVVTKDERLKAALSTKGQIKTIKDFAEFERNVDDYFKDEYFISRLREEVDSDIKTESIENTWLNAQGNWVIKVICSSGTYYIEVDFSSREIIGYIDFDFLVNIDGLITSGSFRVTHEWIDSVKEHVNFFSDNDIYRLVKAAAENDQIYSIADDEDVRDFFTNLYRSKSQIIEGDLKENFEKYFKIL
jgi:rRNA-processing protein FCF1